MKETKQKYLKIEVDPKTNVDNDNNYSIDKVLQVMVDFDEISLVISKDDFELVKKYKDKFEDQKFVFFDDKTAAMLYQNNEPLFGIFFKKIQLEENEHFEITKILYKLNIEPLLPKEYDEFNIEVLHLISNVFKYIDGIVLSTGENNQDQFYRYSVRKKIYKTYSSYYTKGRVSLVNFLSELSYGFGIINNKEYFEN